jgi:hypothetical protein
MDFLMLCGQVWTDYVVWMEEKMNACRILEGKPGRSKIRRKNNINGLF